MEEIVSTILKLDVIMQEQLAPLDTLREAGSTGLPLSELSKKLDVTKGNITGLIDRLERHGLVQLKSNPEDRRTVRAVITSKGRKVLRDIQRVRNRYIKELHQRFSAEEMRELNALLTRLLESANVEFVTHGTQRETTRTEELRLVPLSELAYDESARPIEEILKELAAEVPDEEWDRLPSDLTDNLDHYLYGDSEV